MIVSQNHEYANFLNIISTVHCIQLDFFVDMTIVKLFSCDG